MYEYKATLLRVIDGDTVDASIDLGFDIHVKKRIRLQGIDAWESRTRNLTEKRKGLLAKQWLHDILALHDNKFILQSSKVGKFGRCIGIIYVENDAKNNKKILVNINEKLISEGHAKKYPE